MLVNTKAKVGVFSIALGAYLPQFPSLVPEFEAQYDAFKKTLPGTVGAFSAEACFSRLLPCFWRARNCSCMFSILKLVR